MVVCLVFLFILELNISDLRNSIYHRLDLITKFLTNRIVRYIGTVFHRIMQKAGRNRLWPTMHLSQCISHLYDMCHIRSPAFSKLPLMMFLGKLISLNNQIYIFRTFDVGLDLF